MSFRANRGGYSDWGEEKSSTPYIVRFASSIRFLLAPASQPYLLIRNDISYYRLLKLKQLLKNWITK